MQIFNSSIHLVCNDNLRFVFLSHFYILKGLTAKDLTFTEYNQAQFWCAYLPLSSFHLENNNVTLFPIARVDDYESVSSSYVNHTTKSLMYTLGVLYSILGFLFFVMLVS